MSNETSTTDTDKPDLIPLMLRCNLFQALIGPYGHVTMLISNQSKMPLQRGYNTISQRPNDWGNLIEGMAISDEIWLYNNCSCLTLTYFLKNY